MNDLVSSFGLFIGAFFLGAFIIGILIAACRRASNRPDRRGRDDSVHMPWLYVDGGSTSASSGMQPTDSHHRDQHSGSGYRDDGHDRITPDGPSHGDSHDSGPADFGGGDSGGGGDCGGGGDGGGGGGGGD